MLVKEPGTEEYGGGREQTYRVVYREKKKREDIISCSAFSLKRLCGLFHTSVPKIRAGVL